VQGSLFRGPVLRGRESSAKSLLTASFPCAKPGKRAPRFLQKQLYREPKSCQIGAVKSYVALQAKISHPNMDALERQLGHFEKYLGGRRCVFCGFPVVWRTGRGYFLCQRCGKLKAPKKLERELLIIAGFNEQVPAHRLARELSLNYRTVQRVYRRLRSLIYDSSEEECAKTFGEIQIGREPLETRRGSKNVKYEARRGVAMAVLVHPEGKVFTKTAYSIKPGRVLDILRKYSRQSVVFYCHSYPGTWSRFRHKITSKLRGTRLYDYEEDMDYIDSFLWDFREGLSKYRNVSRRGLILYVKELEFRFNHPQSGMLDELVRLYFSSP